MTLGKEDLYCVMTSAGSKEEFTSPEAYRDAYATASRLASEEANVVAIVTEQHAKNRRRWCDEYRRDGECGCPAEHVS